MTKSAWFALLIVVIVGLLFFITAVYQLIGLWQSYPKILANGIVFAVGVVLSLLGWILVLPKKALLFFLSLFYSETALKNEQAYGTSGYLSNYSPTLAFFFKLNSYKWSKPIGLIILVLGIFLMIRFY